MIHTVIHKAMRWVSIAEFNASAEFTFLKACNECLVLTAKAFVPGYAPLDYLLAYGETVLVCPVCLFLGPYLFSVCDCPSGCFLDLALKCRGRLYCVYLIVLLVVVVVGIDRSPPRVK